VVSLFTLHSSLVTRHSSFRIPNSALIITTRDPSLPHPDLEPGALTAYTELPGLGRLDALELAGQILKDRGIPRPAREKLSDLLVFLGGHPLSIQLVVPHLRNNTPEKLIAEFDALLPGFTTGAGKERNQSLQVSLDFSLRRLGDETRQVLPDLAVFQGGAMEAFIVNITGFKIAQWRQVRDELARAALLTIDQGATIGIKTDEGNFSGYYVRFHPTLLPYLAPQLTPARRAELETRYAQAYYALANYEYQEDNKNPLPTRAIVSRELPNFRRALDLVVAADDLDTAAVFATSIAKFLNAFGRWSERDAMMGEVEKAIRDQGLVNQGSGIPQSAIRNQQSKMAGGPSSTVTQSEFLMLSNQGDRLWQMGRAGEAEQVFRALLARLGEEPSYERAQTFGRLGRCLESQGRQGAAAEMYQAELAALTPLEQSKDVKRQTGIAHTDLADVLTDMGQFDAARQEYEASLVIHREMHNDRDVAVNLGQLGTLALRQNDLNEARRRYLDALAIFRNMGEAQMEAVAWHQLGEVAYTANDWAEAERCYKESLGIKERLNDVAGAARASNQLALVAERAGRLDEAERWYLRAIELKEKVGNPQQLASSLNNLAGLYLHQNQLDEVERFAHRAREIKETLDLSSQPWTTYNTLAEIAEKRGRMEEAREWRRKEQETYQAYVDRSGGQVIDPAVRQWEPVIQMVVAVCNGNVQAVQELEPFLQKMETQDNWRNLIPVLRRIMAGERGVEMTEGLDRTDAAIVRRVLGLLDQPSPPRLRQPLPESGEGSAPSPSAPSPSQGDHGPRSEAEEGGRDEGAGQVESDPLQQWEPVLQAVVAACRGNQRAVQQLDPFLNDMAQEADWRNLVAVLRRIMQGERGVELAQGLDPVDTAIVRRVLTLLQSPSSQPSPSTGEGRGEGESSEGESEEGITIEDILNLVIAGAQGDEQAGRQAYQIAQAMQQDRNAPYEIRMLGKGLQNVLEGLRGAEAMQGLPPEAAQIVQVVLAQLE
jgi:tetratricopeptide (TPR) repeat protein